MRILSILAIIVQFIILTSCSPGSSGKDIPGAIKGEIDLRNWDFAKDGVIEISGEWEFYWEKLLFESDFTGTDKPPVTGYGHVPDFWNLYEFNGESFPGEGYATYRLRILLDDKYGKGKEGQIAFMFHDMGTAYRFYANGREISSGGTVGKNKMESVPGYWPNVSDFQPDSNQLEIILQISNFHFWKGGPWESIIIGSEKEVREKREGRLTLALFLFGSIFIMGFYHLVLFFFRKQDRSYIYFGIFSLLIALRILVTGEYYFFRLFPGAAWGTVLKIEYLTFYIGFPVFFMFIQSLFYREFSKKILYLIVAFGAIFSFIVILTPSGMYTHTMKVYQVISFVFSIFGLYVLILAVWRKREDIIPFFVGFVILFATVINDTLYSNMIIQTGYLVPFGLFAFIFSQALLLSLRFSRAFTSVEKMSGELESKNKRLLDLDKLKDEFLANASHELRTPLNGIIGLAEVMYEDAGSLSSDLAKLNISLIVSSGRRLSNLVNDILDFSKLKNRDIELMLSSVDMRSLTDVVIELLRPLANRKELNMINSIDPDSPLVYADENRVEQILHNLVGNAIKFTECGEVMISTEIIPGNAEEKKFMRVAISDTGIGIPEDKLDVIFESFEQADGSISREHGGTGIGLSIVKQLVSLHGGKTSVESEVKKGSVFSFTLPLYAGQDKAVRTEKRPVFKKKDVDIKKMIENISIKKRDKNGGCGKILVVDDDIVNLEVANNYLSHEDYTVVTATGGHEALGLLKQRDFDLILLDVMMPKMSGYEVCQNIREKFSLYELPVIMLTARNNISDLIAGFESGSNDYLTKPLNREELLVRVRTLVALKKTVKEHDEAKYKLLQERMSPHFLFNALNTVHALINKDSKTADEAVIKLANIYRYLLDQSFMSLIPFEEEWTFLVNYLELEELRFRDTLEVNIDKKGIFEGISIPPLTIQPIVENSLKHGLRNKGGLGKIYVSGEIEKDSVKVVVIDNGIGLKSDDLFSRSLGNIIKRLKYHFKNVEFDIKNGKDGGVIVTLIFNF